MGSGAIAGLPGEPIPTLFSGKPEPRNCYDLLVPIQILAPDVAQKIAAGEVVERPSSAVKELVENALDAGARSIQIEIQGGGLSMIRVVDDGCGIPADEVELAFVRHATSKLTTADDLSAIATLGFRGEALASIAAISQLTVHTRTCDAESGVSLAIEGGQVRERRPFAGATGTTILVRNLFVNVPARLKFLRTAVGEAGQIGHLIEQFALAQPDVRFRLVNEGRRVIETPGTGNVLDALRCIYDGPTADRMIAIQGEATHLKLRVSGYASEPNTTRATRASISLFVNRRCVRNASLSYAIEDAYYPALLAGRHPIVALHLDVPPNDVDVNVHPAKTEVRLVNERAVFGAVRDAVRAALMEVAPLPEVGAALAPVGGGMPDSPDDWSSPGGDRQWDWSNGSRAPRDAGGGADDNGFAARDGQETALDTNGLVANGPITDRPPFSPDGNFGPGFVSRLRPVGQVQNTYIVAEGPGGVYFIDQHTAHERVRYEDILAQRRSARELGAQALLEPIPVPLSPRLQQVIRKHAGDLAQIGFAVEEFGPDTWLLRTIPLGLGRANPEQVFLDALETLTGDMIGPDGADRLAATLACHGAVRAGDPLTMPEIERLLQLLEQTDVTRYCPHGRPIVVRLPVAQLERDFHRR